MLTRLFLKSIDILQYFLLLLLILSLFCSSHSTSISTLNHLSSSNQFQLMSNSSYRNFLLRQYFIDLLNISHASLVRSMIYDHQLPSRSIQSHNRRRKRFDSISTSSSPIFTLQSSNCQMIDHRVQSTFIWSQSIESLAAIELIYHVDSMERRQSTLPLHIKFKHSQNLIELLIIDTYLEFDFNRDFYSINIFPSIIQVNHPELIIECYLTDETCQTSHTYMIISSKIPYLKPNSTLSFDLRQLSQRQIDPTSSICKLKTIQIKFEDLGLAYLIIRPREYTFTYCDGTCLYSSFEQQQQQQQQQQSSMHALFQSIMNRKNPNIPQPTCAPSQFADDNFLLRQMDGTMEIHPIKDVIVKQCACL